MQKQADKALTTERSLTDLSTLNLKGSNERMSIRRKADMEFGQLLPNLTKAQIRKNITRKNSDFISKKKCILNI